MRLGIVSDTHDDGAAVERSVEVFEREGCDAVVHCGDVVAPFSAAPFDVGSPDDGFDFYAVRGNNDGEWALADAVAEFGTYLGEMGELTFDGLEFAVYHGTSEPVVDALVDCGRYDYVLHGHTHEFAREKRDGTVRLNPGGIPFEAAPGPQYAVVLETESEDIERYEL